jgi:ubiquinone/menaquinone biosynthesis C-methylase UbiE
METDSIDTVVSSWTVCSIPDVEQALVEVRRVLRPNGRFIFVEHGRAPDRSVSKWQDRLLPVFRPLAGCFLNRAIDELIEAAGFKFVELEKDYFDGPRLLSYHYVGQARPN